MKKGDFGAKSLQWSKKYTVVFQTGRGYERTF